VSEVLVDVASADVLKRLGLFRYVHRLVVVATILVQVGNAWLCRLIEVDHCPHLGAIAGLRLQHLRVCILSANAGLLDQIRY